MELTNEAIAERLGWRVCPNGFTSDSEGSTYRVVLWKSPTGKVFDHVPLFKTDFTACFGPGGPWKDLVGYFESVAIITNQGSDFDLDGETVSRVAGKQDGETTLFSWQPTECVAICAAMMEVSGG